MPQATALLVLRAHTGIHAGVGQEVGTVDLPIQRERVTDFPTIRGPSVKGALRQAAEDAGMDRKTLVKWIFGPDTNEAHEHAGALSVGDARLLLFPMRSLAGTFAWLTCPFALKRLQRDLDDSGLSGLCKLDDPPPVGGERVLVAEGSRIAFAPPGSAQQRNPLVVVEDFGFSVEPAAPERNPVNALISKLAPLKLGEQELKERLAILRDDRFQNFARFCTEVVTRVHLDDKKKTVMDGHFWTEELLPAETVLVVTLLCSDERTGRGEKRKSGKELLSELIRTVGARLQLGGKETVGYGVCHATWLGPIEPTVGR